MSRRIVGVEMDVWTANEVEVAVRDGIGDVLAHVRANPTPFQWEQLALRIMARLKGERA